MNIKTLPCRREEFVQWVEMLPDTQTPSWLGLPNNAEKVLLTTQGKSRILAMSSLDYQATILTKKQNRNKNFAKESIAFSFSLNIIGLSSPETDQEPVN